MADSWATGALGGRSAAMSQLYAGSGHRQWAPPSGPDRRRWTEVVHHTFGAAGYPGDTDPAAMQDQPQAEAGPFGSRDQLRHVGFDLDRVRAPGQAQPPREPGDMGVDGKPGNAEGHAQHHIGGLPADPGQSDQVLHPRRHLTPEPLDQGGTAGNDRLRLDVEKSGRLDEGLHRLGI